MLTAPVALIREMEKSAIASGIAEYELMCRAGIQAADWIRKHFPRASRFVVLCGGGNNGGDALVAAAHLLPAPVIVYSTKERNAFTGCAANAVLDLPPEIPFQVRRNLSAFDFRPGDVIIDGLLGIGFGGGMLRPEVQSFIESANNSGSPVIALDLPSGIDADTGKAAANGAIKAYATLTFGRPKPGLLIGQGRELRGILRVLDIGLTGDDPAGMAVFSNLEARKMIPRFASDCHKNSRGKVMIWGSSGEYPGAAALSTLAALKAGAGIVRCASEADLHHRLCNAAIFQQLAKGEVPENFLAQSDVLVCGCGWGSCASRENLCRALAFDGTLVLDADALNIAAKYPECWAKRDDIIITPHPGEASRLLTAFGITGGDSREGIAVSLAEKLGAVVILKGRDSVSAAPGQAPVIIAAGSPMLATAGSGDVLAGVIGALAGSKLSAFEAAALGAYIHGIAGENADGILIADELPHRIAQVIVQLQNNRII